MLSRNNGKNSKKRIRVEQIPNKANLSGTLGLHIAHGANLDEIVRLWLECFSSENTKKAYSYFLGKFVRDTGKHPLALNSLWFDEYVKTELAKGINISTIKAYLNCLSSLYYFVESKVFSFKNPIPLVKVRLPETIKRQVINIRKRALSKKILVELLEKFSLEEKEIGFEPLGFFLFRMLLNTGARISELLSLELYDPKKDTGEYINYVRLDKEDAYVLILGKANKPREFYLNKSIAAYLRKHEAVPGRKLFISSKGKPLTRFGAYHLLKQIEKKYLKGFDIFKFSPHSVRHSYITEQVRANQDSLNIAKTVGNSRSVIEKYYLSTPKNINEDFCLI